MSKQFTKDQFVGWANEEMTKGVNANKHGFHRGYVSYVVGSQPASACVVVRGYSSSNHTVTFHTDIRSPKVKAMQDNTAVSFLTYDAELALQIRFKAQCKIFYKTDRNMLVWQSMRKMSKKCYASQCGPGQVISHYSHQPIIATLNAEGDQKHDNEYDMAIENFAIVDCHFYIMDILYLSHKGHIRCRCDYQNISPKIEWIAP